MSKECKGIFTANFDQLVASIRDVHEALSAQASKAVNISLTVRNWLIGHHIREYEQSGLDRATYGDRLLNNLALRLQQQGMKRVAERELRRYRQFYMVYPQIRESLTPEVRKLLPDTGRLVREMREKYRAVTGVGT